MDQQNVRTRSSKQDTGPDAGNVQSRFGDRWPFPINGQVKVWTAKQRKAYKDRQIQDAEEALL